MIATFVFCGAVHDLVTMIARGGPAFFFTPWFFFLGVGVWVGRALGMDLSDRPWHWRAAANLAYVSTCLALTLALAQLDG